MRYREDEATARSETRADGAEDRRHFSATQVADHEHRDHAVELLPRKVLEGGGIPGPESHRARRTVRGRLLRAPDHLAGDIDAEHRPRAGLRHQAGDVPLSTPQIQHVLA